jgi:hypothetical protein
VAVAAALALPEDGGLVAAFAIAAVPTPRASTAPVVAAQRRVRILVDSNMFTPLVAVPSVV